MKLASKTVSSLVLSFVFAMAVSLTPTRASAQSGAWRVDQEHSIARLSLGAGTQSVEAGIAHVDGRAVLDPADPAGARFELTIRRGEATGPAYSEIGFKSKRSTIDANGRLVVVGDLTVTRVVRPVQADANEGYQGAQYGEPVASTNTSQVKLVFPELKPALSQGGDIRISASAIVNGEDFPLLQAALQSGDWPSAVVEDLQPAPLSTVGEDYAGIPESGSSVVTATDSVALGSGSGYYGFEAAVQPDAGKASIALDLKLAPALSAGSDLTPASGN